MGALEETRRPVRKLRPTGEWEAGKVAGEHGSWGTPLSDRAGIFGPDKIGIFDRHSYGGLAEESCRLNQLIIKYSIY